MTWRAISGRPCRTGAVVVETELGNDGLSGTGAAARVAWTLGGGAPSVAHVDFAALAVGAAATASVTLAAPRADRAVYPITVAWPARQRPPRHPTHFDPPFLELPGIL